MNVFDCRSDDALIAFAVYDPFFWVAKGLVGFLNLGRG
jgi:hypothetical protein